MKQQLSNLQFIFLIIWIVMAAGVIFLPYMMAHFVTRDSWISASLFGFTAIILYIVGWLFVRACPNQTLVGGLVQGLGSWVGRGLALVFIAFMFLATAMFQRKTTLFIEESVLPQTPLIVIDMFIIIPVGYAVHHGLEVLGRMSDLLTPLAGLVTLAVCLLSVRYVHPAYILPVLADGWDPVLKGAVVPWRFAIESLLCLQFANALKDPKKQLPRNLLIAGVIMTIAGVLAHLLIVSVLGEQLAYSKYPLLEVVKSIRYGDFFQRLDPLYVGGVLMLLMLQVSLFLYVLTTAVAETFAVADYRNVVWPAAVAVFSASILFWSDGENLDSFIVRTTPALFVMVLLGLPLVAIISNFIRQRNRSTRPTAKTQ